MTTIPVTTIPVTTGTIMLFSDLACPFAHIAVHRIHSARTRLGLDGRLHIDHHAFPLELLNDAPGSRHGSDSEIPVLGPLEPDAGWQIWQGPDYHYPNTMLLAFEAVQAAKAQSLAFSERYDRALRRAFWAESRPVHLHHELLNVAYRIDGIDTDQLDHDLSHGTHRATLFDDLATVRSGAVTMSPHLFLPDGTNITNPGITVHWQGDWTKGFPVVDHNDPGVYDHLLQRSLSPTATSPSEPDGISFDTKREGP